jgi:gluconate 2-dehydrogenase alpha chain
VTYVDTENREFDQPADIVIITAYQMDNVRLMLLSGTGRPYDRDSGEGVVGRNYAYQTISMAKLFFEGQHLNPFIGAGALVQGLDDFNSDNFDHSKLDFVGGASIVVHQTNGRPIASSSNVPPGTPRWGSAWKQAFAKYYQNYNYVYCQGNSFEPRHHL